MNDIDKFYDNIYYNSDNIDIRTIDKYQSLLKKLNSINGDLNPDDIKYMFADMIDEGFIKYNSIVKIYSLRESTKEIDGISYPAKYINYRIISKVRISGKTKENLLENTKIYCNYRDKCFSILRDIYDHKNLNNKYNKYNRFYVGFNDSDLVVDDSSYYEYNKIDEFDLWPKKVLWI